MTCRSARKVPVYDAEPPPDRDHYRSGGGGGGWDVVAIALGLIIGHWLFG